MWPVGYVQWLKCVCQALIILACMGSLPSPIDFPRPASLSHKESLALGSRGKSHLTELRDMTQSWNFSSTGMGITSLCTLVPDTVQIFHNPVLSWMTYLEGYQTEASTLTKLS